MEFIEQLKSSLDIVSVVRAYVPSLRKAGVAWKGLCPFHQEKTPSFNVNPKLNIFKCFGCGKGGNAIDFVMEMDGLPFWEACTRLAEQNGIPLPKRSDGVDPNSKKRASLYEMNELAQRIFRQQLAGGAGGDARAYLQKRGLRPETVELFGLGLSDRSGQSVTRRLEQESMPADLLEISGLVLKRNEGQGYFDRFRGRLMFPIHNDAGKLIAFAGRAMVDGDEPKYLNSPETEVYRKSHVLYNLHRAKDAIRKQDVAILVEGYMDVIGVTQGGVPEVVASCGTALTDQQVKLLKRFSDQIVVNFDPDTAGTNATERSIGLLLKEGMRVKVLELEEELDPDEYIQQHGPDAYRERLQAAPNYFTWLADQAKRKFDTTTTEGRMQGFRFLLPSIRQIPSSLERLALAGDLASYLGVDAAAVREQLQRAVDQDGSRQVVRAAVPHSERLLVNSLLTHPEARDAALERLRGSTVLDGLTARNVLRTMLALHETNPAFRFDELQARLEEADQDLLLTLVFADEIREETLTVEQAIACVQRLEVSGRDAVRAQMRTRVKEAERSGDVAGAIRLMEELGRLERG